MFWQSKSFIFINFLYENALWIQEMVYTFDEASKKQLKIELDTLISCNSPYIVNCYNAFYNVTINNFHFIFIYKKTERNSSYRIRIHGPWNFDVDS